MEGEIKLKVFKILLENQKWVSTQEGGIPQLEGGQLVKLCHITKLQFINPHWEPLGLFDPALILHVYLWNSKD